MYSYVIVTIVCYIYLQLFRTLLGWELGEQIMNCFLLKPAEPETCLGRRTKPILHSWPRRHAGKGSWLSSRLQNTVPGSGERVCIVTWVFLEMHLSDSKLDNEGGWKKLLYSLFFTFSFNLCLLEHPSLCSAKHQWQKWRQQFFLGGQVHWQTSEHLLGRMLVRYTYRAHQKLKWRHSGMREPVYSKAWPCEEKC